MLYSSASEVKLNHPCVDEVNTVCSAASLSHSSAACKQLRPPRRALKSVFVFVLSLTKQSGCRRHSELLNPQRAQSCWGEPHSGTASTDQETTAAQTNPSWCTSVCHRAFHHSFNVSLLGLKVLTQFETGQTQRKKKARAGDGTFDFI